MRGRVQNVGFRYWVLTEAQRLGLVGYVRNRADGGVDVKAEGPEEHLRELEMVLWRGPFLANVEEVETEYSNETAGETEFVIKR